MHGSECQIESPTASKMKILEMKVGIKLCDNLDKRLGSFQFQTSGAQRVNCAPGKFTYNVTFTLIWNSPKTRNQF